MKTTSIEKLRPLLACFGLACAGSGCSSEFRDTEVELARRSAALEVAHFVPIESSPFAGIRSHAGSAYDSTRGVSVIFGGHAPPNQSGQGLKDTWLWDGSRWNSPPAGYGQRSFISGVFDRQRRLVLSYGGHYNNAVYTSDTWEFDGLNWTSRAVQPNPGRRSSYGLAYDSIRNVSVLFGGYDGQWNDDVWEWDGARWTERCTLAPCSTSPRPSARANAAFVFDEARRAAVLFGGYGPGGSRSDTWLWDGTQFTRAEGGAAPSPRDSAAVTYDPVSSRVLLFGGIQSDGTEMNDLWAWNGAWKQLADTTPASPRQGAALTWDMGRRQAVLVGGENQGQPVEAWVFRVNGNSCSSDSECHEGTCAAGFCSTSGDTPASGAGGSAGMTGQNAAGRAGDSNAGGGVSGAGGTTFIAGGATSSSAGGTAAGTVTSPSAGVSGSGAPASNSGGSSSPASGGTAGNGAAWGAGALGGTLSSSSPIGGNAASGADSILPPQTPLSVYACSVGILPGRENRAARGSLGLISCAGLCAALLLRRRRFSSAHRQ